MKLTFCGFLSERQQKEKTDFESQPTRATGFQPCYQQQERESIIKCNKMKCFAYVESLLRC